jgi:hypothetical protein
MLRNYQSNLKLISSWLRSQFPLSIPHLLIDQTGDVERSHLPQNNPLQMMNESIADCIATLCIRDEEKNGEALIKDALLELKKTMSSLGFPGSSFNSRK